MSHIGFYGCLFGRRNGGARPGLPRYCSTLVTLGSGSCDREVVVVGLVITLQERGCVWGGVRDEATTQQGIRIDVAGELKWTPKKPAVHEEHVMPGGKIHLNRQDVPRSQSNRGTGLERRHKVAPAMTIHVSIGGESQFTDPVTPWVPIRI